MASDMGNAVAAMPCSRTRMRIRMFVMLSFRNSLALRLLVPAVASIVFALPQSVAAHGSVTNEDDLCAIEIGYLRAHFKIYLPATRGHDDFCEDLPATGKATFVMEYIHRGLGELPMEFRIIENVTGMGRFTKTQHVDEISNLDAITEFLVPMALHPDVFTVMHEFDVSGEYVGIVTVDDPVNGKQHHAVFPFEVGFTGFGYWPAIAAAIVALHLQYLYMSGRKPFRRQSRLSAVDTAPRSSA